MITKESPLNNKLFDEANKFLAELGIKDKDNKDINIQSLEEYFNHLNDLVGPEDTSRTEEQRKKGLLFLRLPLDEPLFVINANDRTIKVPDIKSVVGDVVAEIVFFEIDRFYDATDLSTMQIGIEWEVGSKKGRSKAFIRDVESRAQEDKLIFGWPISSEITETAGKVKFAVRFYQVDANNKFIYSFSTIPHTISISNGLAYDIDEVELEDSSALILGRVFNSPLEGIEKPGIPKFVYSYPTGTTFNEQINSLTLFALGDKIGGGSLSYKWSRGDLNNKEQEEELSKYLTTLESGDYFEVTEWITNYTTYFIKNQEEQFEKIIITSEEDFNLKKVVYESIYVLCSIYELTSENVKPGIYKVKLNNSYYGQNAQSTEALEWEVAATLQPGITIDVPEVKINDGSPIIDFDAENLANSINNYDKDITTFYWSKKDGTVIEEDERKKAIYTPPEGDEGYYTLTITNTKNNDIKSFTTDEILCVYEIEELTENNLVIENIGSNTLNVTIVDREQSSSFEETEFKWYLANSSTVLSETSECKNAEPGKTYKVVATISKGNGAIKKSISKIYTYSVSV